MKNMIAFAIVATTILFSQAGDFTQRIVKGTVVDQNGKKCGVKVMVEAPGKPKIKFDTKEGVGTFEQVMDVGKIYEFTFIGDEFLRETQKITIEQPDKDFSPQIVTLNAKRLIPGTKIMEGDIFSDGSSSLNSKAAEMVKELKMMLRFNREANVDIEIHGKDQAQAKARKAAFMAETSKIRRFDERANVMAVSGDAPNETVIKVRKVVSKMK